MLIHASDESFAISSDGAGSVFEGPNVTFAVPAGTYSTFTFGWSGSWADTANLADLNLQMELFNLGLSESVVGFPAPVGDGPYAPTYSPGAGSSSASILAMINAAAGGGLTMRTIIDFFSATSGTATFTTSALTLTINTSSPVTTSLTQAHVQMYKDDASNGSGLNGASHYNQIDSQLSLFAGSRVRARFNLRQSIGSTTVNRYVLQYRVNGGSWTYATGSSQVAIAASSYFADLAGTTQRISTGPFVAGVGIESAVDTGALSIDSTVSLKDTELEWSLLLDSTFVMFDYIQLRVVAVASVWSGATVTAYPLSTYSIYGAVMVLGGLMTVERATIYEASQWVPEVTPGTALAAIKRLLCVEVDPDNTFNVKMYRRMGVKFPVKADIGKEYSTSRLMGNVAYNDICYLLDTLLTTVSPTTPANPAIWTVGVGAASAGTFTLTFNGQTTAANVFGVTAAALEAAIGALSTVGTGNVSVSGASPTWTVTFIGALSTTELALTGAGTGLTGGAFVSTAAAAATLTRRRTYFPLFDRPDTFRTYTVEKGIPGQANLAQQLAYFCLTNMDMKFNKDEASFTGGAISLKAVDPFTLTTSSVVDVEPVPVAPDSMSVFAGDALVGSSGVQRLRRCFEFDLGISGRSGPVITLDDSVTSFSAVVEKQTEWSATLVVAHDSASQTLLSKLRGGTTQYLVFEAKGALIETAFPYRFKITLPCKFTAGPTGEVDGVMTKQWAVAPIYDNAFGGGIKVEVDNKMASL